MFGFDRKLDGIRINGVDTTKRNEAGKIKEFKFVLRPLNAGNLINWKLAATLVVSQ